MRYKKDKKEFVSKQDAEKMIKAHFKDYEINPGKIFNIALEFAKGFYFLRKYKKAVSIFGSARAEENSKMYQEACQLAGFLAKDGFAIITGGGPGVMEGANKGAVQAGGRSVGLNIKLRGKQPLNRYIRESEEFSYFFARKTMLSFASQVYIFFPGGFGTLDEFFEMIMLIQTQKIPRIPVILVYRHYWEPLLRWIKGCLYEEHNLVDKRDLDIYYLVDSAEEAYELIKKLIKPSASDK